MLLSWLSPTVVDGGVVEDVKDVLIDGAEDLPQPEGDDLLRPESLKIFRKVS